MPQFSDGNEWSETQFLNLEEGWNTISFFVDMSIEIKILLFQISSRILQLKVESEAP